LKETKKENSKANKIKTKQNKGKNKTKTEKKPNQQQRRNRLGIYPLNRLVNFSMATLYLGFSTAKLLTEF
jgi:hypothetical protein